MNESHQIYMLEPVERPDIVGRAERILRNVDERCEIGGASMLILLDERRPRIREYIAANLRHLETKWSDGAIDFTVAVIDAIAGEAGSGLGGPSEQAIRRFDSLFLATRTAITERRSGAAGLIRCCCLAAQELRRGGSTGKLGPVRLRAKLLTARLIGLLARRERARALQLACLNLHASGISLAQIADETGPTNGRVPDESVEAIRHPALAACVLGYCAHRANDGGAARSFLEKAWTLLNAEKDAEAGGAQRDLYRAAVARVMARIDGPLGFAWSGAVSDAALRCSGRLLACLDGPAWPHESRIAGLRQLLTDLRQNQLLDTELALGQLTIGIVAEAKIYPEFPPLTWDEISKPELTPGARLSCAGKDLLE